MTNNSSSQSSSWRNTAFLHSCIFSPSSFAHCTTWKRCIRSCFICSCHSCGDRRRRLVYAMEAVHMRIKPYGVSVSLCTSPIVSQSHSQSRCVRVSLCTSPIVPESHCVPVTLCPSLIVYQSHGVSVSLCTSPIVSQSHCVSFSFPVSLCPRLIVYQSHCAPVSLCASHIVSESHCVSIP